MATGISPVPGCFGNIKVRWNPKAVKLREWRKQVQEIQKLHTASFEGHILTAIAKCVAPNNWPSTMPFSAVLGSTECGGHPSCIFNCIELARRLKPGSNPWRTGTGYSGSSTIVTGIEAAKPYIRYIIQNGEGDDQKKLARWLLREAKALKIDIPPIPVIPPKPYARKPAVVKVTAVEGEISDET